MVKLNKGIVRYWITLGFKLGRLEFLWGSKFAEAQEVFESSKAEVVSMVDKEAIVTGDNYQNFCSGILNYYLRQEEIFSCINMGIAIQRCSLFNACHSTSQKESMKSLALSAIRNSFLSADDQDVVFSLIYKNYNLDLNALCELIYSFLSENNSIENEQVTFGEKYLFISYSSKDYAIATRVKQVLEQAGIECWMAPDSIQAGADYSEVIVDAINNSNGIVFCVTENSQVSKWVPKEIDMAITADKIVYPVHLDNSKILKKINFRIVDFQMVEAQHNLDECLKKIIYAVNGEKKREIGVENNLEDSLALYLKAKELYENENYLEALPLFFKSAEQGNYDAICYLGIMYSFGKGVEVNKPKAFNYFKQAAENGNIEASFQLGAAYLLEEGTIKDIDLAIRWLEIAANENHNLAQMFLGSIFGFKSHNRYNRDKGIYWLEKADTPQAWIRIAVILNETATTIEDVNKASKYLEKAAASEENYNKNDIDGIRENLKKLKQNIINSTLKSYSSVNDGEYYYNQGQEHFSKYQYQDGLKSMKKAAEFGHVKAMMSLGRIYEMGELVIRNYNNALLWYQKAMEQDYPDAYFAAANLYYFGYLGKHDYSKAYELCKLAAAKGCFVAQKELPNYRKAADRF